MPYVGLKSGDKLWYEEKGRGMPIVFLHGWMGSTWVFSNQIDYFSKTYRVLAFDHKGHGKSDRPRDATYTMPEFAEELDEAIDKLIGDEKFVLIGHSMGGFISLTYATTPNFQKRLKGLILMSTGSKSRSQMYDESKDMIKKGEMALVDRTIVENMGVPACFKRKYRETHSDVIKEFVEQMLKNSEYVAVRTLVNFNEHYNVEDKLERINVPTLILTGDEDAMVSPEESKLMHEKIKNSELKIFSPKIGHMIQFEATEDCNRVVDEFLKKLQ